MAKKDLKTEGELDRIGYSFMGMFTLKGSDKVFSINTTSNEDVVLARPGDQVSFYHDKNNTLDGKDFTNISYRENT
jgi:hypothetical protein